MSLTQLLTSTKNLVLSLLVGLSLYTPLTAEILIKDEASKPSQKTSVKQDIDHILGFSDRDYYTKDLYKLYLQISSCRRDGTIDKSSESYNKSYDLNEDGIITPEEATIYLIRNWDFKKEVISQFFFSHANPLISENPGAIDAIIERFGNPNVGDDPNGTAPRSIYNIIDFVLSDGYIPRFGDPWFNKGRGRPITEGQKQSIYETAISSIEKLKGGKEDEQTKVSAERCRLMTALAILARYGENEKVFTAMDKLSDLQLWSYVEQWSWIEPNMYLILRDMACHGDLEAFKRIQSYCSDRDKFDEPHEAMFTIWSNYKTPDNIKDLALKTILDICKEEIPQQTESMHLSKFKRSALESLCTNVVNETEGVGVGSTKDGGTIMKRGISDEHLRQLLPILVDAYLNKVRADDFRDADSRGALTVCYRHNIHAKLSTPKAQFYELIGGTGFESYDWSLWTHFMVRVYNHEHEKEAHELVEKTCGILERNISIFNNLSPREFVLTFFDLYSPDLTSPSISTGLTDAGYYEGRLKQSYALTEVLERFPNLRSMLKRNIEELREPEKLRFKSMYDDLDRERIRIDEMKGVKGIGEHGDYSEREVYKKYFLNQEDSTAKPQQNLLVK